VIWEKFLFERVDAMEPGFDLLAVVVNKGTVPAGIDVVIAWDVEGVGSNSISGTVIKKIRQHYPYDVYVACNPNPDLGLPKLKPDWTPPKLKKGWMTWDGNGGWWWWPAEPVHTDQYGWVDSSAGGGGDGQEICEVMAEFLGCPDCTGFDERNCIWEVGE
jgi:hypothetical protein